MKKFFEALKTVEHISATDGTIVIFGAGVQGKKLYRDLCAMGIKVSSFWDNDPSKSGVQIGQVQVTQPPERMSPANGNFFICIALENDIAFRDVRNMLESRYGLTEGIHFADFFVDTDSRFHKDAVPLMDVPVKTYDLFEKSANPAAKRMNSPDFIKFMLKDYILIPDLDLKVNTYCTRNCNHCACLTPYIKNKRNFDVNIVDDLDKLLEVAYAASLCFLGGEPLLHPELHTIINKVVDMKNYNHIARTILITNGDIVPSDEVLAAFSRLFKGIFIVNDYGTSPKIQEIIEKLERFGIRHSIAVKEVWIDHGEVYKRNYSAEELRHLYALCESYVCLYDGRFYACGRGSSMNEEGLIGRCESDYVDVRNLESDVLKEKLTAYYYGKTNLNACDFCSGKHPGCAEICMGG